MSDRCKDKEADEHPSTSRNKRLAPTVVLNDIQTNKRNQKVNRVQNYLRLVAVDRHRLKDGSAVVKEVVRTGKLLKHLERHSDENTISHAGRFPHVHEFLDGALLDVTLGAELGLNFFHLSMDRPMVWRRAVYFAESFTRTVDFAIAVVKTGRVRKKQNSNAENKSKNPADADDDAPAC
jgi:hypothetical protein